MQYLVRIENVKRTSSHMLSDIRWTVGMENELSVSGNIILEHNIRVLVVSAAAFFVTARAGTAYRQLFDAVSKFVNIIL